MESNISAIPIELKQLEQFNDRTNRLLECVRWTPKPDWFPGGRTEQPPAAPLAWRESTTAPAAVEELSLLRIARRLHPDSILLSEEANHVLSVLRQALRIAMHLSRTYTRFCGLDQLITLNSRGALSDAQKTEFRGKYQTASLITVFVSAYYCLYELTKYKAEDVSALKIDFGGIPELSLQDPVRALDCLLFYYAAYLERSGVVRTDLDFVKLTLLYFQAALNEVQLRVQEAQYVELFSGQSYKLENSEFCIKGFSAELDGAQESVEFNRVQLDEIVGNRDAKHYVRRLAGRLLCYDPVSKKNPMFDMGALPPVSLGYGEPGTGKSMLIAAMATMLDNLCRTLGVPFLFWPMPDTIVSTFQGGSAERMMNWMRVLKDPSKIIYAPIDDAENNLEDRTRQGVSAGVREVIAVFLRNTEGAYAVNRGNTLIQLFTNLPDQIDKAVLSRINSRSYIGGATTKSDFLDQDYLWLKKYRGIDSRFVNMKDPADYCYLADQAALSTLSDICAAPEPAEEKLRPIVRAAAQCHRSDEHAFFAELFLRVKQAWPGFTSRDVRNIQRAIDGRIMDFDLPDEWFEQPELFFKKDYAAKRAMIVELMSANMGKLSFAEIRFQETIRYLDNMLRIAEGGRERRVAELAEELRLRREAELRFLGKEADSR